MCCICNLQVLNLNDACIMHYYQHVVNITLKLNFTAGSVPLRQLVYRVLALPPSMQPLVYDFGQLTDNTEKDYTTQIVTDCVSNLNSYLYKAR